MHSITISTIIELYIYFASYLVFVTIMVADSTVDIVVAVAVSHYNEAAAVAVIGIAHTAAAVVVVVDMVALIVVVASKKRLTAASSLVSNTSWVWLVYIVVVVELNHLPSSWMPLVVFALVADILAAVGKRCCTVGSELVAASS